MTEYWTMKEIGVLFGVSSHVIGRKLKEIGLRTMEGKPSRAAFDAGMCDQRWASDWSGYCWAWSKDRTVAALERAGPRRLEPESDVGRGEIDGGQSPAAD